MGNSGGPVICDNRIAGMIVRDGNDERVAAINMKTIQEFSSAELFHLESNFSFRTKIGRIKSRFSIHFGVGYGNEVKNSFERLINEDYYSNQIDFLDAKFPDGIKQYFSFGIQYYSNSNIVYLLEYAQTKGSNYIPKDICRLMFGSEGNENHSIYHKFIDFSIGLDQLKMKKSISLVPFILVGLDFKHDLPEKIVPFTYVDQFGFTQYTNACGNIEYNISNNRDTKYSMGIGLKSTIYLKSKLGVNFSSQYRVSEFGDSFSYGLQILYLFPINN